MITFDKARCAELAKELCGRKILTDEFTAIGWMRHDKLTACALFDSMSDSNIEITIAITGKHGLSPGFIRACYRYVFNQLKVSRVTAHIRPSNHASLKAAKHFGFREEGRSPKWYGDEDAIIFGFLPEYISHGKFT